MRWKVQAFFSIALHKKDLAILEKKKFTWGVGEIYIHGKNTVQYKVGSTKELQVIIDHFDKYPLITKKREDYLLFKSVFELMCSKEHLTCEGLQKILSLKASMNNGLPEKLKAAFPGITPSERPCVSLPTDCKNPYWLAGFTSGEGCFIVNLTNSSSNTIGFQVKLLFRLSQHNWDKQLMTSLIEYFGCGNIYKSGVAFDFTVTKIKDLANIIIPFFDKYPLCGVKYQDYLDFVKVLKLMENKSHLTEEGLDQIRKIKAGMNMGRI